ncbi:hypothetical protein FBU59_007041 [Linderina macrospora]|uniref:Uncharacterized protein n=1 Tax=Linderina macrospora TaxID=4868 RepID=A0ACC1IY59_9FUNG|nr:hypothetical protein FBU59_007041 [Linderina macrospora]
MMEGPATTPGGNNAGMYTAPPGQAQQVSPVNGGGAPFAAAASGKSVDDPNAKSLYVGNLDPRVTEQTLFEVFSSACPVVAVKIIPDKRVSRCGGLCY